MRDDKDRRLCHAAKQDATDALYDASPEAIAERLARFQRRVVESPIDRACQSLTMAGDDVNAAVHLAKTQGELAQIRDLILETIARLETSWRVAMHLEEYGDQRGQS